MSAFDSSHPGIPHLPTDQPRASLVILSGPGEGRTIQSRRVVTLIGSREGCKLTLKHPRVAPVHAAIISSGSEIWLRDLATPSETLLNGLRLEQEKAQDGDVLTIGSWDIRIDIDPGQEHGDSHPEWIDLDQAPTVVALEQVSTHRVFKPSREICLIGRRVGCDICIDDPHISRVHALLFNYCDRPVMADLLASRSLRVNDRETAFAVLRDGDSVRIGSAEFLARLSHPFSKHQDRPSPNPAAPVPTPPDENVQALVDLIDIRAAEKSRKWTIVDNLEKARRPSGSRR